MKFANMPADKLSLAEVARMARIIVDDVRYYTDESGYVARALLALLPVVEAAQAWRNESTDATEPLTRLQTGEAASIKCAVEQAVNSVRS